MVNVGILGAGNISETHARAIIAIEGATLAAIHGQNQEKAKRLAQLYGGAVHESLASFLEHRPLDLVVIGSPSGVHAEQGIMAARRGLHVLVEKPIDTNLERADALITECERARVKLGVLFQDRVAPDICRFKELVVSGRIGKPILVSASVNWYRPPEYYSNSRWRGTIALDGGGALINQGVHTVDTLLWLLGDVERVYAKAVTALHKIDAEDTLVATLEFACGAIGTLTVATSAYPGYARRIELTGSAGTVILEHDRIVAADLREPAADLIPAAEGDANASATSPVVSDIRGHRLLIEDFLLAIARDGRPRCDGPEGRRSLALVEAIYNSARTGQPVALA